MPVNIPYVSAPCGAGKTYATVAYIKSILPLTNVLYVGLTGAVLDNAEKELLAAGIEYKRINSGTNEGHVISTLTEEIKAAPASGCVILATWEAYVGIRYFNRPGNWREFVDEPPPIDDFLSPCLPRNKKHIADYVELGPPYNERLSSIIPHGDAIEKILAGPHDDIDAQYIPFWRKVVSEKWSIFADTESFVRLVERGQVSRRDNELNRFAFVALLKPDWLNGVTFIGANFEDSMLYDWFSRCGVIFTPCTEILSRMRQVTPHNREVTINYMLETTSFSKWQQRQLQPGSNETTIEAMERTAREYYGEEKFLFAVNKDRDGIASQGVPNAIKIPVSAQGTNDYDHIDNSYFGAALNRKPVFGRMLTNLGFDRQFVQQATAHETMYQDALRTSLRNPGATNPLKFTVPDRASAQRLAQLLNVTQINKIGNIVAIRQPALTQVQRNNRSIGKKLRQQLIGGNSLRFLKDRKSVTKNVQLNEQLIEQLSLPEATPKAERRGGAPSFHLCGFFHPYEGMAAVSIQGSAVHNS